MREESLIRVGAALRRVPGMAGLLDARVAARDRWRRWRFAARDAGQLAELARAGALRLNVGCGPGTLPGWVNLDITRRPGVLVMDAAREWPLPDDSARAVNSEHFIEHLSAGEAARYFAEAHRVLEPGGVIRTSTPDLEGMAAAYSGGDASLLEAHRSHGYEARNLADLVNNYFYSHGHRHIYDFATLAGMLAEAGFTEIERAVFGESSHRDLAGIDTHDAGPLRGLVVVVDAVKPDRTISRG